MRWAAQQAVEADGRASSLPAPSSPSPVVEYHGRGHRIRLARGFLMRPLLNSGTLGGRTTEDMDFRVTPRADHRVFEGVARALAEQLRGAWVRRLDGLEQRYWDLAFAGSSQVTLHLEHYLGIFVLSDASPDISCAGPLERAAAAIPKRDEWTCEISFDALFCPGDESEERLPLSTGLTDLNDHIHGRLEIRVHGRVLPRLGFCGSHDVCLNSWLEELTRALHALDAATDSSYVYDEGEQGQPAFVFERNSASLFVSVRESPVSGARGDDDWNRVVCDFEDFRLQILRFRGLLHEALRAELGVERALEWLTTMNAA